MYLFSAEPNFEDEAEYSVRIKVGDNWLDDDAPGTFCGDKCIFTVSKKLLIQGGPYKFLKINWILYYIRKHPRDAKGTLRIIFNNYIPIIYFDLFSTVKPKHQNCIT